MSEKVYCVYMHTSPSGKAYIGLTSNYKKRCYSHQYQKNKHQCTAFFNAIKKHGWGNFTHEILKDNLTLEQAKSEEKRLIALYNTFTPHGYNLTTGGEGCKVSEETKKRVGSASKKTHAMPEFKEKFSALMASVNNRPELIEKHKQIANSPEFKEKMSNAVKKAINRTEVKEKIRLAFSCPINKAKRSESAKKANSRLDVKLKISNALIEAHKRPDVKAKRIAAFSILKEKRKASKIAKQKEFAEKWNSGCLSENNNGIPILFGYMQQDLFLK